MFDIKNYFYKYLLIIKNILDTIIFNLKNNV